MCIRDSFSFLVKLTLTLGHKHLAPVLLLFLQIGFQLLFLFRFLRRTEIRLLYYYFFGLVWIFVTTWISISFPVIWLWVLFLFFLFCFWLFTAALRNLNLCCFNASQRVDFSLTIWDILLRLIIDEWTQMCGRRLFKCKKGNNLPDRADMVLWEAKTGC